MIPGIRRFLRPSSLRQLHHTHTSAISRFGGLALVTPFLVIACFAILYYPAEHGVVNERLVVVGSAFAMFLLGAWDDARPLGAKRKLLGQILIASAVYIAGIRIGTIRNPFTGSDFILGNWSYFATVFWLIAFTNLINLIDGIDGVAGGISLIVMALLLYVGWQSDRPFPILCAAGMCGALLGFLCYNFPPATIYLGDGGAYFLGFLVGLLSMVHSHKGTVVGSLIAPLFVLALPIVDVTLAILRRAVKGMPIFHPDRRHLHHRLADLGLSRTRIVLMFYSCSLFFLLLGFAIFVSQGRWLPIAFGVACLVLLATARSFSFSRRWFAIGKLLGKSKEVRKKTRHAQALAHWFELEAERSQSPEQLWTDFCFVSTRLGFSSVLLSTPHGEKQWTREETDPSSSRMHLRKFDLPNHSSCEFRAAGERLDSDSFELVTTLAAEMWIKAINAWRVAHHTPFSFIRTGEPSIIQPVVTRLTSDRGSAPGRLSLSSVFRFVFNALSRLRDFASQVLGRGVARPDA